MEMQTLTTNVREHLREQRREQRLLLAQARERNFQYIINRPVIPKVAFGSGVPRETLPTSGPNLTSFMRRNQGETREYPGPLEYDVSKGLDKDFPSKMGFSCFASKTLRLPQVEMSPVPPVGTYFVDDEEEEEEEQQMAKPFGIGAKREGPKQFLTPGPNTYHCHKEKSKENVCMAFGGARIIWPAVAVFCSPTEVIKCFKCGKVPFGDYWHNFTTRKNICRPCMNAEEATLRQCTIDHAIRVRTRFFLNNFRPVRSCAYFHTHWGTTKTASQIMTSEHNRLKIRKENYFFKFQDERI